MDNLKVRALFNKVTNKINLNAVTSQNGVKLEMLERLRNEVVDLLDDLQELNYDHQSFVNHEAHQKLCFEQLRTNLTALQKHSETFMNGLQTINMRGDVLSEKTGRLYKLVGDMIERESISKAKSEFTLNALTETLNELIACVATLLEEKRDLIDDVNDLNGRIQKGQNLIQFIKEAIEVLKHDAAIKIDTNNQFNIDNKMLQSTVAEAVATNAAQKLQLAVENEQSENLESQIVSLSKHIETNREIAVKSLEAEEIRAKEIHSNDLSKMWTVFEQHYLEFINNYKKQVEEYRKQNKQLEDKLKKELNDKILLHNDVKSASKIRNETAEKLAGEVALVKNANELIEKQIGEKTLQIEELKNEFRVVKPPIQTRRDSSDSDFTPPYSPLYKSSKNPFASSQDSVCSDSGIHEKRKKLVHKETRGKPIKKMTTLPYRLKHGINLSGYAVSSDEEK